MRIAVIGAGTVGLSLAEGFARAGHEVVLGTRDDSRPETASLVAELSGRLRTAGYRAAVEGADLVVLAVPGRLVVDVADAIGADAFEGTAVVDPSNPVVVGDDGVSSAFGEEDSAAEALQRALPTAHVVKAFNQIEAAHMLDRLPDERRPMRIAGDDDPSKALVAGLLESFGWTVRDLGPLSRARPLERAAVEWAARQQDS